MQRISIDIRNEQIVTICTTEWFWDEVISKKDIDGRFVYVANGNEMKEDEFCPVLLKHQGGVDFIVAFMELCAKESKRLENSGVLYPIGCELANPNGYKMAFDVLDEDSKRRIVKAVVELALVVDWGHVGDMARYIIKDESIASLIDKSIIISYYYTFSKYGFNRWLNGLPKGIMNEMDFTDSYIDGITYDYGGSTFEEEDSDLPEYDEDSLSDITDELVECEAYYEEFRDYIKVQKTEFLRLCLKKMDVPASAISAIEQAKNGG